MAVAWLVVTAVAAAFTLVGDGAARELGRLAWPPVRYRLTAERSFSSRRHSFWRSLPTFRRHCGAKRVVDEAGQCAAFLKPGVQTFVRSFTRVAPLSTVQIPLWPRRATHRAGAIFFALT